MLRYAPIATETPHQEHLVALTTPFVTGQGAILIRTIGPLQRSTVLWQRLPLGQFRDSSTVRSVTDLSIVAEHSIVKTATSKSRRIHQPGGRTIRTLTLRQRRGMLPYALIVTETSIQEHRAALTTLSATGMKILSGRQEGAEDHC